MLIWPMGFVVALTGVLWLIQRRLIYLPTGHVPPIESVLPGWDEVAVSTSDGLTLAAWWSEPDEDAPVVMVLPGNAGNRADRATLGAALAGRGLGVLLVEYRGYGGNPGAPGEEELARDAGAAADLIAVLAPGHQLVYFGESLGAAVAIELATRRPPVALILRSPFTSLAAVGAEHYPFLPVRLLLRDRFPSDERITDVGAAVLVIAGSADSIVPVSQSRTIYELARGPSELLIVDGADHNDPELAGGPIVVETIARFIAEVTAG